MENKLEIEKDLVSKVKKTRKAWAMADAIRDFGLKEPVDVKKCRDITYCESETEDEKVWHLTDIYYPLMDNVAENKGATKGEKGYQVIVNVHGGGWFYGDKKLYRFYAMHLAQKGFAVVNFNYRLSPEYPYPCGLSDVCHLMDFIARNSEQYELDLDNLFMVGDSAGAQLVSQYCILATNSEYQKQFDFIKDLKVPVPKKVGLNCGIYDMKERYEKDRMLCDFYLRKGISKEVLDSFLNVLDYMNADFPKTYLMGSVNDALLVYSKPMLEKLKTLGIEHVYREFGEGNPKDGHVFHVNMKSENGMKCNQEEVDFFLEFKSEEEN